jgi:hypothetical protein
MPATTAESSIAEIGIAHCAAERGACGTGLAPVRKSLLSRRPDTFYFRQSVTY